MYDMPTTPEIEKHRARLAVLHSKPMYAMTPEGRRAHWEKRAQEHKSIAADIFQAECDRNRAYIEALAPDYDLATRHTPDTNWTDIKITTWYPDSCACVVNYVWSRKHDDKDRTHHPIEVLNSCSAHASLTDPVEHFNAVIAANRAK